MKEFELIKSALSPLFEKIPVFGTFFEMYSSLQNEVRFQRVETFLVEVSQQIDGSIKIEKNLDYTQWVGTIETIIEDVSYAKNQVKKEYFKNILIHHLNFSDSQIKWNIDDQIVYTLENINILDFDILNWIQSNPKVQLQNMLLKDYPAGISQAGINNLDNLGLIHKNISGITVGSQGSNNIFTGSITEFGNEFITYITSEQEN
ncbi:MAG: hypothetical protein LBC17_01085 [Lactobacillaceae bacterium]|jgi:hypothetical protein|nr:hypothetical protein [Lactobacillaceae bacterium]